MAVFWTYCFCGGAIRHSWNDGKLSQSTRRSNPEDSYFHVTYISLSSFWIDVSYRCVNRVGRESELFVVLNSTNCGWRPLTTWRRTTPQWLSTWRMWTTTLPCSSDPRTAPRSRRKTTGTCPSECCRSWLRMTQLSLHEPSTGRHASVTAVLASLEYPSDCRVNNAYLINTVLKLKALICPRAFEPQAVQTSEGVEV